MKRFISGFITALSLLMLVGCHSLLYKNEGILGKDTKKQDAIYTDLQNIDKQIAQTDSEKLTHIGAWAEGTKYSLLKATNQEPAVTTAEKINDRVIALSNKPNTEELNEIYKIIDALLTNQITGNKMLEKKDKEISQLENEISQLNEDKDNTIKNYMDTARKSALEADQYKATLKQLDSGWGLSAVWYGLKKFISRIAITLGIMAVLFIILRILSSSNPIAGAVMSIFEQIVSWFIRGIKIIFPKCLDYAGHISTDIYNNMYGILKKIVDNIQNLKSLQEKLGHDLTVKELLVDLDKSLDSSEKNTIDDIKKQLGY